MEAAAAPGPAKRPAKYNAFISYSHAADLHSAAAVQQGLQRLARPWYRRRALRVFRDESELTATPSLWTTITGALDESDAFVLMASPEAARSRWVEQEIARWRESHGMDRFFIVMTGGEIAWDHERGDFDWSRTDCLPAALRGAFVEEPLFVDLRFVRGEETADLRHPRLRAAVARLAAGLRGVTVDDLISEDVRLHRRALRLAWSAVATLVLVTAAAVTGGVLALRARDEAGRARLEAEGRAVTANARRLALQSVVSDRVEQQPDLGLLLALQSLKVEPSFIAYRSLLSSLAGMSEVEVYLRAGGRDLRAVVFSADGREVSALTVEEAVLTWDLGAPRREPRTGGFRQGDGVWRSEQGPEVLAGFEGQLVAVDRLSGTLARPDGAAVKVSQLGGADLPTIPVDGHDVRALAVAAGGAWLAVGTRAGAITLWNTRTGRPAGKTMTYRDADGDAQAVTALSVAPGGGRVIAGYEDGALVAWNPRLPEPTLQLLQMLYSEANRLVLDRTGDRVLVAYGSSVSLWTVPSMREEPFVGTGAIVQDVAFSSDEQRIAAISRDVVVVWNLAEHDTFSRPFHSPHRSSVVAAAITADGRAARTVDYQGLVVNWDLSRIPTRAEAAQLPAQPGARAELGGQGRWLVSLEEEGRSLVRRDLSLPAPVVVSQVSLQGEGTGLALAAGADVAAVALEDGGLAVYRFEPGRAALVWTGKAPEPVFKVALDDTGRWLAGSYESKGFFVRDLKSGSERSTRGGHEGMVSGLAFNRDASLLATGGYDQRVGLWRLPDLRLEGDLRKGHSGTAHTIVAFNPATGQLVSSGSDALVLLWPPVNEPEQALPLLGHGRPAYALAFTPDGRRLLAGDGNQKVFLWDIDPALWRQRACRMVNRNLTADEWRTYGGPGPYQETCALDP
jgi:WD40 repeat protein